MEERRGRAERRQAGRGKWIFHRMSDNDYTNIGWEGRWTGTETGSGTGT